MIKHFRPDQTNLTQLQVVRDFPGSTGNVTDKRTNHRRAIISVGSGGQLQADLEGKR